MVDDTPTKVAIISTNVTRIMADINDIKNDMRQIRSDNENRYISKEEFEPVRRIVYGLVALILIGVVGALLTLILRR